MFENEEIKTRAVLVSADIGEFDAEESMDELSELASSAGAEVLGTMIQKRPVYDTATCIGEGRLLELADFCETSGANLIIFDHELTATQIRNIEEAARTRVIDRTMLILDIFAARAVSSEGKLQVELAQQKYRLPRLAGLGTSLSRLGGGIGTRGPGETKLETDKRHIRKRIASLEEELRELEKRRRQGRIRRRKDSVLTAAIVGYTNAGKSTLLNHLTGAGVLAEDKLFATLDTTSRALELPDGRSVLLVDTVGLLRRLPHHLVEAFHSTLEEAADADIILHVCDASDAGVIHKAEVTNALLEELGCGNIPKILVLNKCDKTNFSDIPEDGRTVKISAKTGEGIDRLLLAITKNLPCTFKKMKLLIPYKSASLLSRIREDGKVFKEEYTPDGISAEALLDIKLISAASEFQAE